MFLKQQEQSSAQELRKVAILATSRSIRLIISSAESTGLDEPAAKIPELSFTW